MSAFKVVLAPVHRLARKAAKAYVVGPALDDAIEAARALALQGAASTISFWDGPEDTPSRVTAMYLRAIASIAASGLDSYLSIKAPSLGFDDGLMAEVGDAAAEAGLRLHFDSLGAETAGPTLWLMEALQQRGKPRLSCTLPARWRRSLRDAEWAIDGGIMVRVVKGQWPDPEAPDRDPRRGFLELIDALAGRAPEVAVATHDPELAAAAVAKLRAAGSRCEMELLFGLPCRAALRVAGERGLPVRYYLPYGNAWLPYAVRQAGRNPHILWWMLRDALSGQPRLPIGTPGGK